MSPTSQKKSIQEGDRETLFIPAKGQRVTVVYCYRDIEWEEEGLQGIIEHVLVGVDKDTNEIVIYPPSATEAIKSWREAEIETRGLDEKCL